MTNGEEIAVYAGQGSSHSWTWLADLFEAGGINRVRFLDKREFVLHLRPETRCAIVSGGDGFRIAEALSGDGFRALRDFIERGGTYVGICAGAYLPLHSRMTPFSEFNVSDTKIENIDHRLRDLSGIPSRVAVQYGSCAIVHPVRGEVKIEWGGNELLVPIYGGPVFSEPVDGQVLARYRAFTEKTDFQMSKAFAQKMVLDKVASVRSQLGKGSLILLGPHLEHPQYQQANLLFLKMLGLKNLARIPSGGVTDYNSLDKAVADLKVAIVGLENRSFVVGKKLWDGGRYMELVRAIESRTWTMGIDLAEDIATSLWRVRDDLKSTKVGAETDADAATELLVESARACVDNHFQTLARGR